MDNCHSRGMALIEVLVALFILATGILGAVAMQTTAKKGSFDAMQRSLASAMAQDIIERIRSNDVSEAILESYEGNYGENARPLPDNLCNNVASPCTAQQIATNDLYEWTNALQGANSKLSNNNTGGLIDARGCITHNAQLVTVVVSWAGRSEVKGAGGGNCDSSADKRRSIVLTAFLF
ncbi:type IV pilus modification protein PilV [Thalassotalea euphylliae]|uniref:Type IV pilus modification protein PilV n=1 Tax=Thalassotalea euphylliae TaxID=1655234 RepID=A0A3E0UF66_9GAMM|nr:type IV pilus modification protein PilV [Thalassotalea euphylliae]REL34765.1 type IV pilus modification protein PilV [Thalassotalea euphylliae]